MINADNDDYIILYIMYGSYELLVILVLLERFNEISIIEVL